MTVSNLITSIRIILAPIFIIYLINDQLLSGLVVFVICGVSDGVDGLVARLFKQKSRLGTYLDPLADKIILISAFVVLAVRGLLPSWLTVMVISRDTLILLGVIVIYINNMKLDIKPSLTSKITTCLQFITVIAVLSHGYISFISGFIIYLYYITALFTIISGLHYMHYWFKMMGESPDNV
ncbi:MAG: CDP-alcohol phosphatidyltransferase family protein [Deltaproteobacteria bacterium]|nr:CDP-alcohol phosphatidyltransferase family protein [Deltaproteobacteria bacterium]